jgi:hypothetical protein
MRATQGGSAPHARVPAVGCSVKAVFTVEAGLEGVCRRNAVPNLFVRACVHWFALLLERVDVDDSKQIHPAQAQ